MNGRFWLRILAANVLAAFAALGLNGLLAPAARWHGFWRGLWVSLVYANTIGALMGLTIPRVARRSLARSARAQSLFLILIPTITLLAVIGAFIATVLLLGIGVVPRPLFWDWVVRCIYTSLVIALIMGFAVTTYETLRARLAEASLALRTKERDEAEARRLTAEAQLAALESRVQPHFLFNTLNSIAALIPSNPAGAEQMTTQLASLLRSSLDHQTALVTLDDELRVVRNYLDIEQVRFGNRLRYDISVESAAQRARVPRLSVQTLVENSLKYAVSHRREGGSIAVRAVVDDGHVRIRVADDGPGFDPSALPEGHGLALLRTRLAMLFGEGATLQIRSEPDGTAVTIELPAA